MICVIWVLIFSHAVCFGLGARLHVVHMCVRAACYPSKTGVNVANELRSNDGVHILRKS